MCIPCFSRVPLFPRPFPLCVSPRSPRFFVLQRLRQGASPFPPSPRVCTGHRPSGCNALSQPIARRAGGRGATPPPPARGGAPDALLMDTGPPRLFLSPARAPRGAPHFDPLPARAIARPRPTPQPLILLPAPPRPFGAGAPSGPGCPRAIASSL
ncbi:MAG: hypothetical protein J3K34DRAFT_415154 [Monoraphidium minutum]|nr:MAG: hypothetical protein J3K34DRAFT_415154 [Monoraphidium minutum]